jgi:hypothetical protein
VIDLAAEIAAHEDAITATVLAAATTTTTYSNEKRNKRIKN